MSAAIRECRYCTETHGTSFLCEPARLVLDALAERGMRFDMPTIEFPEPVKNAVGMFGGTTVLVQQLVAKGGLLPVAGVTRPVLILTGQDADGRTLPEWVFPASPADLRRATQLITDMGEMAIRRARDERQVAGDA